MIYKFESFIVDTYEVKLYNLENVEEIEPKLFSLLEYFCTNSNRAISREELIHNVWNERIVSNAAINRAIVSVRQSTPSF